MTLARAFRNTVSGHPDRVAVRTRDDEIAWTWAALKGVSPLVGQACVIGDGRPYNTALILLDSDFGPAWAAQRGIDGADLATLARDERMRAAVQKGVDAANERLSRVEQIKKFTLVEGDWLPGGDELTPTMKLKRKPIAQKYAGDIDAMY